MTRTCKADLETWRSRLLARRRELRHLVAAGADHRRPVAVDQSRVGRLTRMEALQEQAVAIETDRRRGVELKRIEAALERIKAGDFGYCMACGEVIAPERLEFDPTAPLCMACASAARPPATR